MNNLSEFLSTLYGTMNNTMSGIATGFDIYKQEKQRKDYNILNSDYEKFQKIIDLTDSTNRNFTDDNSFIQSMSENGIDESYSKAFLDYVGYDFNNKDIKLETYITSKGLGTESWQMKKLEEANYQQEMNKVISFVSEKYDNYTRTRINNNSGVINLLSFGDVKEEFQDFSSQINSESISQATGINKETVDRILEDEKYIEQETNWYNTYFRNVIEPISKAEVEAKTITNAQTISYEVLYSCLNNGMDLYSTLDSVNSALNSSGIDYVSDKTQRNKIFWNTVNIAVDEKYKQFGRDNWQLSDEEFLSKLNAELESDYKKIVTKYGEDIKSQLLSTFFTNKDNAISSYKNKVENELEIKKKVENELKNATENELKEYGDDLSVAINNVSNKIEKDPEKYKDYTLQDFLKEEGIDEEKFTQYMDNYASATLREKYSNVEKKFYLSNKTLKENYNKELDEETKNRNETLENNYKNIMAEFTKQKKYEFSSADPSIVAEITDDEIVQLYGFDSYEIYYNNKDKVPSFINDGIRTLQEERNSARNKLETIKENSKKAKDEETKALESIISKNSQRLLDEKDSSLMKMSDNEIINYITSGKIQTLEDFNKYATTEMLYWYSKIRNKINEQNANLLITPYKESMLIEAQIARTTSELLDVRTDATLQFENGKYVFKETENGKEIMWNDPKFDIYGMNEVKASYTENNTPKDESFIDVTAYKEFNEYLISKFGSDTSKWDIDTVKALAKAWNSSFKDTLTNEEIRKETADVVESKIYKLAMSGDLTTATKIYNYYAFSENPYWTPQDAKKIKDNIEYAIRGEVKAIFNEVENEIKKLNLPDSNNLEGRFTIPFENIVYYSDKYTNKEMTLEDIRSEVIKNTIEKYNSDRIKDAEKEINNIQSNLNLSSFPSSNNIKESANVLEYGYQIIGNLASGKPIVGYLTEGEFNTIYASMQGYNSEDAYEKLNDTVSQVLYGCNYSDIKNLKKDDKKTTDTDFLKSVVIKNSASLVYMDKKIERLEWCANIILKAKEENFVNGSYDLKPVFFNGDVALYCPQKDSIYSIPDNTNSYKVFEYKVQSKYRTDIESITKSSSIPKISNDLLAKDNDDYILDIKDLYGKAFNK